MKINLTDTERIITDSMQFIVQAKRIVQASKSTKEENVGNEVWDNVGYFASINYALRYISKNIVLENDDFFVMIEKLNQLDIKIDEVKELLENTRIKELLEIKNMPFDEEDTEELKAEEYEGEI